MTQTACCDHSIAPAARAHKLIEARGSSRGGAKGRARRIIPGMKVRQRDRAQLLGQVPLFSYCSQRELAKVAKLANELELPAGHTLIHEGAEVAYPFFVLVDGEADVRRRNRRVATLGPGDCFGELALILSPAPNRHGDADGSIPAALDQRAQLPSVADDVVRDPVLSCSRRWRSGSHRRRHNGGTAVDAGRPSLLP
jgi:hypothetical protein